MLFKYNRWRFAGAVQKQAPNFGGTEYWWEVRYVHEDGRTAFGAAPTKEEAAERAMVNAYYQERPVAPPAPQGLVGDEDIPF